MTIGEKIKHIRQSNKMSQFDIEDKTGIKREYLSKIENNELTNPTYNTITKIAKTFEMSPGELLDYEPCKDAEVFKEKADLIIKEIREVDSQIKAENKQLATMISRLQNLKIRKMALYTTMARMEK